MSEFWQATPRHLWNAQRAYARRRGWLAWHTAALGRIDKFPDLGELTGDHKPKKQSREQMAGVLKQFAGAARANREMMGKT